MRQINKIGCYAFHFDLDTNVLRSIFGYEDTQYTKGYREVGRVLNELGFEHRQGSGCVSEEPISIFRAVDTAKILSKSLPWLKDAVKKFDVTEVGMQWDLLDDIRNFGVTKANETDLFHFNDLNDEDNDFINETIRDYDLYNKTEILNDYYPSLLEQYINEKDDPDIDLIIDMYEGIIDEDEFIDKWLNRENEKGREL